jgi:hypothetical protein
LDKFIQQLGIERAKIREWRRAYQYFILSS